MFPNLLAEMARDGITNKDLSEITGLTERTIRLRFKGVYDWTLPEMEVIREKKFPDKTLEYLFTRKKGGAT